MHVCTCLHNKKVEVKNKTEKTNVCVRVCGLCVWEKEMVFQVLKAGTVAERWAQLAFLSVIAPRRKC